MALEEGFRHKVRAMDEATARFGFLGAAGLSTVCAAASLWLGLHAEPGGAALFLVLALAGLAAGAWFQRIHARLRRARWQGELRRSQQALDTLLHEATPPAEEQVEQHQPKS